MRVLVSGSSGFIGTAVVSALEAAGHSPLRLVRGPVTGPDQISWDIGASRLDPGSLSGVEAVVHLAGAGIGDHRWTNQYKREILNSRVDGTALLTRALTQMEAPPSVLVSGSAVGYYGDRADEELTEDSSPGAGFLAEVAQAWEGATAPAAAAGIRTVLLRTGLVLAAGGGTLGRLSSQFKWGLGGKIGDGRQWWSWIALDDEVGAILHSLGAETLRGPVNATAPNPVTNAEFSRILGASLHRPTPLSVPASVLSVVLGQERSRELVLGSQRALPAALERSGYVFGHSVLADAMPTLLAPL
jgi:uncharacterized protein (TIGR01777 family)